MDVSTKCALRWLHLLIVALSISVSAAAPRFRKSPRLSPTGGDIPDNANLFSAKSVSAGQKTYYYTQTLDHFSFRPESFQTFQQRYVIDTTYWGGSDSNAPILAYLGAEASIDSDVAGVGFMYDNAAKLKPLILFIEHRYYGQSLPFGSMGRDFGSIEILGYFDSAQALADYAQVILHVKEAYNATYSPVIVVGGSYGGMLASWFRLKYPHVAMGALASSAPILYFHGITPDDAYFDLVSQDYRSESEHCYRTIKRSWLMIESLCSQPGGLAFLSNRFQTCSPLRSAAELEEFLIDMFSKAAQYNRPPTYPVKAICEAIDEAPLGGDILSRIFAGVLAYYRGSNNNCFINPLSPQHPSDTLVGWAWQACSEMIIPLATGNNSMFPPDPFDLDNFCQYCESVYGVPPRPDWIPTYYGGHDIILLLKRFGSNIIFSNGLKDPYSSGGVLKNISNSIVAVTTTEGSHCLDIMYASESDPNWLVNQRAREVSIMQGWLTKYNADLKASKHH